MTAPNLSQIGDISPPILINKRQIAHDWIRNNVDETCAFLLENYFSLILALSRL
jgi:hypothetical protein